MAKKISELPVDTTLSETAVVPIVDGGATSKISAPNLRKAVTGIVGSAGEQLISYDWTIINITYLASGDVNVITFSGPTGSWTYTPHYTAGIVDYITIADPGAANSWRQTLIYVAGNITAMTAWIKQ